MRTKYPVTHRQKIKPRIFEDFGFHTMLLVEIDGLCFDVAFP